MVVRSIRTRGMATCHDGYAGVSRGHSIRRRRRRAESFIQGAVLDISRDMEQQQTAGYQMALPLEPLCPAATGDGVAETGAVEARQMSPAISKQRALTQDLMARVASLANLTGSQNKIS